LVKSTWIGRAGAVLIGLMFALAVLGLARIHEGWIAARARALRTHPDDRWAACGASVAHAMGGIDGRLYTNTREAFHRNYARGFRVFEIDLALTTDSALVLAHDWYTGSRQGFVGRPTLAAFRRPVYGGLTPLTAGQALHLLREHPDARFVLDPKDGNAALLPALIREARAIDPTLLDRLVPQVLTLEDLRSTLRLYPWPSVIWTLYASRADDEEVYRDASRSGVGVVTISEARFSVGLVQALRRAGIRVYVHTVNSEPQVALYREWGATGVYTDFLPPDSVCR
jgi:glycerophosphoryl diester phosphodiesterase